MRSVLFWLFGASAAFFATAGAFLLLANLGAGPGESGPIPRAPKAGPAGPALDLRFAEDRLGELRRAPGQTLTLYVENRGDTDLPTVDLTLTVTSEDTAGSDARDYRESVEDLAPGERAAVEMEVDFSPPMPAKEAGAGPGDDPEEDREVLEARASAPGEASAFETAVLP